MFSVQVGWKSTISPRIYAFSYQIPDYYSPQSWTVWNSSRVTSEDVTILGSGNFALLEWGGGGGNIYRRVLLTRTRENLLSANCDGFHSFACEKGPIVVDSHLEWQGDDALNFHNRVGLVLSAKQSLTTASTLTVDVIDVGDVPFPGPPGTTDLAEPSRTYASLTKGDSLRFFSATSLQPLDVGAAKVTQVVRVHDKSVVQSAREVIATAASSAKVRPEGIAVWRVTLADSGPGPGTGTGAASFQLPSPRDVVQFDRFASAGGLAVDSIFNDAYDSCFRLQASLVDVGWWGSVGNSIHKHRLTRGCNDLQLIVG